MRGHAVRKLFERALSRDEVLAVVAEGEVIAEYPDDRPYPSLLLLGRPGGRPIHAVVARDHARGLCTVVTVYVPDPALWSRGRRGRGLAVCGLIRVSG